MAPIETIAPIISFTFDDAPKTSLVTGGKILGAYGRRATFFVSLGLLDRQSPSGIIASRQDLARAVADGHELGCHTFDHLDPWKTAPGRFIESVEKNSRALTTVIPGAAFTTFAYPISEPAFRVKRRLEKYFRCCRGGGQTYNAGTTDLNLLKAFFLDRRNKVDMNSVKQLIDDNNANLGWLIFATHDITEQSSPYGCRPEFLDKVVDYAANSGALILPVAEAFDRLWPDKAAPQKV